MSIDPDDDATIFYTSGTTGRPKGAVGTHRNSASNLMNLFFVSTVSGMRRRGPAPKRAAGSRTPTSCRCRSSTPPAATRVLVTNTAAGGKLVMMHHFDPERALELIERERITMFGGVPAMVMQVIDSPNFANRDTSSVRSISYGGAPCPPDLVRRIKQHFPAGAPGNGYGLTETSAMTTMNSGDDYVRKPDSVGTAGAGMRRGRGARGVPGRRAADRPGPRPRTHRRAVDQGAQRGPGLLEPARGDGC